MRARGGGWIVNLGSVTGLSPLRPYREYNKSSGDVIYASTKAALHRQAGTKESDSGTPVRGRGREKH